ncbi:MAG: hypothetical protein IT456_15995 [Planctomycetes bacterium]|nr:hypothetical protein [Planctomycetota bacterium]
MHHSARLASVLCLCGVLEAQCPPGAQMPLDLATQSAVPAEKGPADQRWQMARAALQAGKLEEARQHLLSALEFHPASPALLLDLVRASGEDPDLLALWTERFVRAAADAQGRLKLDAAQKKLLPTNKAFVRQFADAQKLATLRASAVAELARSVEQWKPVAKQANSARSVVVRWLAELLLTTTEHAPNLLASCAANVDKVASAFPPEHDVVIQALLRVLQQKPGAAGSAPETGRASDATAISERAIRAARILLGLHRQANFKDLQGPAPKDLSDVAATARQRLGELEATDVSSTKVWTIAELEQMSPEAAVLWSAQHRTWRTPGIALSPTGKYRVETTCGHETLLGTARTVELHHARLVAHYGQDPFENRQGLVRIVPESSDLETEGAPFWWAGGFQGGDRTTLRFAWGDIPSLGRGLTHELTHRFDGVLHPFVGSWYGEGHASWTGGHYARMADPNFQDDYLDPGSVARTAGKGYGARENFEKLLRGSVDDYRDNYFAGYSLYSFLRSYPPKKEPRYGTALKHFERNARAGQKDPVAWFTSCFCDGKQGRPASFDAFLAEWQGFLSGVSQWLDDKKEGNEWVGDYGKLGTPDAAAMVLDEPTWSWARSRAEPFFGQDHAAAATLLLQEAGDLDGTIAAGLWSIQVDGWRLPTARAVAQALTQRSPEAAMAFAAIAQTRFPSLPGTTNQPLLAQRKQLVAYEQALAARAVELTNNQALVAAGAIAAEHDELARRLGLPLSPQLVLHAPPAVPEHLGGHGLTESSLTGYDDRRVKGLWYATPEGDVHVGREKPREATGTMDRASHQRDAFVHSVAWQQPGTYVLRGRVHFTTAFVAGAIVFGHERRDRDLRLRFSSGDFRYAIGKDEKNRAPGKVNIQLEGLWERDGRLPETKLGWDVDLPKEQGWFDYALHICGPRVLVEINGEQLFRYAVHDGAPIEGQVGFAMGMGAIRVQQPTVQRLDAGTTGVPVGLDVARQPLVPLDDLLQLPTKGLPRSPNGTLVLWLPKVTEGSPTDGLPRMLPGLAKLLEAQHEYPAIWVLAVPADLPAAERTAAALRIAEFRKTPLEIIEHQVGAPFVGDFPWLLFLDDLGVLRAASEFGDARVLTRVEPWARKFRSR